MKAELPVILLSLKVATTAIAFLIPVGTFLGWLFSRKDFMGKTLLNGLVNVPLVLPPVVTGYFLLVLFSPAGLLGRALHLQVAFTWKAAVLASGLVSLPLLVRAVHVAVDSVDPKLEEAARMLRASEWQIFFRVTLPLALHGIVAGAVLAFARALGEFGATIVFASNIPGKTQTIPLAIFTYLNQPGGEAKARGLVLVSILLALASEFVSIFLLRKLRDAETAAG
ncbi:MAG: molybdate ABC transporter permease subunit [Calditrichaeota bacterium]|nr:MAG: molybdate ABC transporter permease subunit [Calditrichota bacterium]